MKAGDTLWLRSYDGELTISSHYNPQVVTIAAQAGQTPKLKSVLVRASSNWLLKGLSVSPEYAPTYERKTLVRLESHSYQGPLEKGHGCQLQSVADASKWTASDWDRGAARGRVASPRFSMSQAAQERGARLGVEVQSSDAARRPLAGARRDEQWMSLRSGGPPALDRAMGYPAAAGE